jgi:hypothetical protein
VIVYKLVKILNFGLVSLSMLLSDCPQKDVDQDSWQFKEGSNHPVHELGREVLKRV